MQNVTFTYSPGTPYAVSALQNVSVGFPQDCFVGIIGRTGSGKSTLVQMLNGLLKPNSGEVLLDGDNIWNAPRKIGRIRFRVGLVMQYPEYQLFEETVEKDVAFGPKNLGLSADEIKQRVREACGFVGLPENTLAVSPFDISGGQKRRVAIAGVMAMRPDVLVLDEPAAGLDPQGRDLIFKGIKAYKDATHATVIIVSHSMEDVARFCDRLVVMSHGEVVVEGKTEDVFAKSELIEEAGLALPEITLVCRRLQENGVPIPSVPYTVEQAVKALSGVLCTESKGGGAQ